MSNIVDNSYMSSYNRMLSFPFSGNQSEKTHYEDFIRKESGFIKICIKGFLTECESRIQTNYKSWINPIIKSLLLYGVVCVDENLNVIDVRYITFYMNKQQTYNKFQNMNPKIIQFSLKTRNLEVNKLWIYTMGIISDYFDAETGMFEYKSIAYEAREMMYRLKEQEMFIDYRRRFNSKPRILMHNEKMPMNDDFELTESVISSGNNTLISDRYDNKSSNGVFNDDNHAIKTYMQTKSNALQYTPLRDPDNDDVINTKRILCQAVFHINASKVGVPPISNTERFSGNKSETVRLEEFQYIKYLNKIVFISNEHKMKKNDIITFKENEPRSEFNKQHFDVLCEIGLTNCIKDYIKTTLGYEQDCVEDDKLNDYLNRLHKTPEKNSPPKQEKILELENPNKRQKNE